MKNNFSILYVLNWFFRLNSVLFNLKPKCSLLITSISITLHIISLFLVVIPIKMLFIINEDFLIEKKYLLLTISNKNELLLFLILIIILISIIYIYLDYFKNTITVKCSSLLDKEKGYFVHLKNQEELLRKIFSSYINVIMNFFILIVIISIIAYLYFKLSLSLIFYLSFMLFIMIFSYNYIKPIRELLDEKIDNISRFISLIGFLFLFSLIMIDIVLLKSNIPIMYSVISLVLLRHALLSTSGIILNIKFLFEQKEQIDIIFFRSQSRYSFSSKKEKKYFEIFKNNFYKNVIFDILQKNLNKDIFLIDYVWQETGLTNVSSFIVTTNTEETYLFKLYNSTVEKKAISEIFLHTNLENLNEIALKFLFEGMYKKFRYVVFQYKKLNFISQEYFKENRLLMLSSIIDIKLKDNILLEYNKNNKFIFQRFGIDSIDIINIACCCKSDIELLEWFKKNIKVILKLVSDLPLSLVVPNISENNLFIDDKNNLCLIDFDGWKIEPLGYGLKITDLEQELLRNKLFDDTNYAKAEIIQYLKSLEYNTKKHFFKKCLNDIKIIKIIYENNFKDC